MAKDISKLDPGIEPGLPEVPDVIRIRSDNRYTNRATMLPPN